MEESARKVIAEHLGVSPSLILDTVSFRSLGADSLDLVSLTMAFEEAFDLHIPDDQAESCTTVGDAMALLSSRFETGEAVLLDE
ncbi:MAG TPA: acyl carrier protein [Allosphingosinicella sp.]|nr:acyl carrier protein [Allosphingosinicella sp.]